MLNFATDTLLAAALPVLRATVAPTGIRVITPQDVGMCPPIQFLDRVMWPVIAPVVPSYRYTPERTTC
jgi:hypothetical protein